MSKYSAAEDDRERRRKADRERELRLVSWSRARNEGIREGLIMALEAIHILPGDTEFIEAVKTRGNRHFGDELWQRKRRTQ